MRYLLILLFLFSCGKSNTTQGPGADVDLSERDTFTSSNIRYLKNNDVSLEVQSFEVFKDKVNSPLRFSTNLIIKNKFIYNHFNNLNLDESFIFGDDYKHTIIGDFSERLSFSNSLENESEGFKATVRLQNNSLNLLSNIHLSFKKIELSTMKVDTVFNQTVNRWEGEPLLLKENEEFLLNLDFKKIDINPSQIFYVDMDKYSLDSNFMIKKKQELYKDYARVYVKTSEGEDVYYVKPGITITNFLREHYEALDLSVDGSILKLANDSSSTKGPTTANDIKDNFWLQYPKNINDIKFEKNRPYLFLYTNKQEYLLNSRSNVESEEYELSENKIEFDIDNGISIFEAILNQNNLNYEKYRTRVGIDYINNPDTGRGGRFDHLKASSTCDATFGRVNSTFSKIPLVENNIPSISNSHSEILNINSISKNSFFLVDDSNSYQLNNNIPSSLHNVQTGYLQLHNCHYFHVTRVHAGTSNQKAGKKFKYKLKRYFLGLQ